jgi:hypothetical protein
MRFNRGASVSELEQVYRADFPRFGRVATAICGDEQSGADAVHDAGGQGFLVRDGLYITIRATSRTEVLAAAKALYPMLSAGSGAGG